MGLIGRSRFRRGVADIHALASGTNRIQSVTTNGTPSRAFTYDAAGNILTDTKNGVTTTYTYNDAGRMAALTVGTIAQGPYLYNGFGQLASRTVTANPTPTLHTIYDQDGNLIFEADAATGEMLREYIWLAGRPVAVVDAAKDSTIYAVHVDHLDRPVMMTDHSGAVVWRADYLPFGEVRTSSGPASLTYRFPGQWFMLETGLHYNWHRWYDASTGRYTQPDPIGMPDGPSRYVYALNSPLMNIDHRGLDAIVIIGSPTIGGGGPSGSNPFGHAAIGIPGHGVFSFGTTEALGTPISDYLKNQSSYRDTVMFKIPATPTQESCLAEYLRSLPPDLPDLLEGALSDNCASRSSAALVKCGLAKWIPFGNLPIGLNHWGNLTGEAMTPIPRGTKIPLSIPSE